MFALLRPLRIGFRTVVKYRKIPPAAAANQIAENARIPPAADLQKNKPRYCTLYRLWISISRFLWHLTRMDNILWVL